MITNPSPQEAYDQSPHRVGILAATHDLWDRLKADRPDLSHPAALTPVILKCAKRHNIMAVKLITAAPGFPDVETGPSFDVVHVFAESDVVTADSRPHNAPAVDMVMDPETGDMVSVPATPRNEIASLERVTIQCPTCRVKQPNRSIVVKSDRLLMLYAAALAQGKASTIIE